MNAVQKKMPESRFLALSELIYSEKVTFLASSKVKKHIINSNIRDKPIWTVSPVSSIPACILILL